MIDFSHKTGIIFDLDGTLWSTSDQIVSPWNEVLSKRGLPTVTTEQINSFMGMTPDMIAASLLPGMPHDEALSVFEECVDGQNRFLASHGGTLCPGLEHTLALLRKKYFLAVVSNCREDYLKLFLDTHGLRRYFDDYEVFGRTHLPKEDNIRLVIERNGIESAVYVGDTELDREAADKAGIPFVWAAYGFGHDVSAGHRIKALHELPHTVKNLLYIQDATHHGHFFHTK